MKHLGAAVVAVAIAFGVSALAQTSEAPAAKSVKRELERVTGKLTKIDGRALTIEGTAAEGKTEEVAVTCSRGTHYWKTKAVAEEAAAGEKGRTHSVLIPAEFDELKVGQEVRVIYHSNDKVAATVTITADVAAPTETPKQE
jgi:hypothetical protein